MICNVRSRHHWQMYLVYPPSSRGSIPQCMSAATQYLVVNLFSEKEVDWFTFMCSQVWLDCWQLEMKVLPLQKDFSQFSILDFTQSRSQHSSQSWTLTVSNLCWPVVNICRLTMMRKNPSDHGSIHDRISSDPGSGVSRPDGYLTPFLISAKKCKITLSLK